MVCQKAFKGKHKIADKWENMPYRIVDKVIGMPMYRVTSTETNARENKECCTEIYSFHSSQEMSVMKSMWR